MKSPLAVMLALALIIVAGAVDAAPVNPWRAFRMGPTGEVYRTAEVTVDEIDFQTEEPSYAVPHLLVFFNLKNVSTRTRVLSVSFALFGENRDLLCVAAPRTPELRARASQNLKVDFGECGHSYAKTGKVKFFQVAVFSPEDKR